MRASVCVTHTVFSLFLQGSTPVYLTETLTNTSSSVMGPRVLAALSHANVDDDNGTPSSLRATWLSWQPTAPPASTFAVPSYCTCTQ
jgi:hypothetical protein